MIDTSSQFSPATLLAIDNTDSLVLVGASDVPTIKSLKIALETLELLEMDVKDVRILMNRSGARVGLDDRDVERTLRREITYTLASDKAIPVSVNRGQPVVIDAPKSRVARSLSRWRARSTRRSGACDEAGQHALAARPPAPARDGGQGQGRGRSRTSCNDPFVEIKNAAQPEAVRELGQAFVEGEVPEDELREHVQKAVDDRPGRGRHAAVDAPTAPAWCARSRRTSSASARSSRSWPTTRSRRSWSTTTTPSTSSARA